MSIRFYYCSLFYFHIKQYDRVQKNYIGYIRSKKLRLVCFCSLTDSKRIASIAWYFCLVAFGRKICWTLLGFTQFVGSISHATSVVDSDDGFVCSRLLWTWLRSVWLMWSTMPAPIASPSTLTTVRTRSLYQQVYRNEKVFPCSWGTFIDICIIVHWSYICTYRIQSTANINETSSGGRPTVNNAIGW